MPIEDIVHEATYPLPATAVWRAIATREGLASWLMENDLVEARPGAEFRFRDRPRPFWDGIAECRITVADPPRHLAMLWNHKKERHPSTVSITLTPTPDGGTHLLLRHSGLHGFMGLLMKRGMDKGWQVRVRHGIPLVAQALERGPAPPREQVKRQIQAAQRGTALRAGA